jgi:hypothetical protein
MITIKEVEDEMLDLQETDTESMKKQEINRLRKRMLFLRSIRTYLETKPTDYFVISELAKTKKLITALLGRFSHGKITNSNIITAMKKNYEKENGIPKMRDHVRALQYLLKK